jgi:ABC-type multidrug transport system ATPase subunit
MSPKDKLIIESLTFSYGIEKILSGIYLEINAQDIIGLIGRNGCGKSTFFKCILKILQNKGIVRFNNKILTKHNIWKYVSYLPQTPFLPQNDKVKTVVKLFIKDKNNIESILCDTRINKFTDTIINRLSGGEKRYLEFLLIINLDRTFIFLDEPFSEIEPKYIKHMQKHMQRKSNTSGLLLTDHNHWSLRDIASRLLIMKNCSINEISNNTEELIKFGYFPNEK